MAVTRKTAPRAGGCRWAREQTIVRLVGGRPGGADRFLPELASGPDLAAVTPPDALIAVMKQGRLHGVIATSRLLTMALKCGLTERAWTAVATGLKTEWAAL